VCLECELSAPNQSFSVLRELIRSVHSADWGSAMKNLSPRWFRSPLARVAVLAAGLVLGLSLVAAPAGAVIGTWTHSVSPNPAAMGETVTISGSITGCDFATPAGSEVFVTVFDPLGNEVTQILAIPADTATNSYSVTYDIPAGGPEGEWFFTVEESLPVPTNCSAPFAKLFLDVVPDSDSPQLALIPVGVVALMCGLVAARRRREPI
jgi:hypothetical protein